MAEKLSRVAQWLVEFAREVDRGIAVGRGYEPSEKENRQMRRAFQVHRGEGRAVCEEANGQGGRKWGVGGGF